MPEILVVVPVLNEARYIDACLHTLLQQQDAPPFAVVVMDGGSTDSTAALVSGWAARDERVSLQPNPGRLQSAAINLAAAGTNAAVLVRADAHAAYPPHFLRDVTRALAERGATAAVVPMRTVGASPFQRAAAAAQNSRLGNGGSAHRAQPRSGWVEHGHHAAFDRAFFRGIGGYDEGFSHNEDAELDVRALQAGGRIWMCAEAAVTYFPRASLSGLARQYLRHGRGRARTVLRHHLRPKLRQLAPVAILLGCVAGLALAPLHPAALLVPAGYAVLCCVWGALAAARARDPALLGMGPAAMAMHLGWAAGFAGTVLRRYWKPDRKLAAE